MRWKVIRRFVSIILAFDDERVSRKTENKLMTPAIWEKEKKKDKRCSNFITIYHGHYALVGRSLIRVIHTNFLLGSWSEEIKDWTCDPSRNRFASYSKLKTRKAKQRQIESQQQQKKAFFSQIARINTIQCRIIQHLLWHTQLEMDFWLIEVILHWTPAAFH